MELDLPLATNVRFSRDLLVVDLDDGRIIGVPIQWFRRLREATSRQRNNFRFIGGDMGISWPEIDEDLSSSWPPRTSATGAGETLRLVNRSPRRVPGHPIPNLLEHVARVVRERGVLDGLTPVDPTVAEHVGVPALVPQLVGGHRTGRPLERRLLLDLLPRLAEELGASFGDWIHLRLQGVED